MAAAVATRQAGGPVTGLLLLAPLLVFLIAVYLVPFGMMVAESFRPFAGDFPPPGTVWTWSHYERTFGSARAMRALGRTFWISGLATLITLVIAYPIALTILRAGDRLKAVLLTITFVSLASSLIVRNYGWLVVLADRGPINGLLMSLGLSAEPIRMVYSEGAIVVGLVHYCLPFMILPIYASLLRIPASLGEASAVLGAGAFTTFRTVTWPLSLPGVFGGTTLTFAICASAFVTPLMLGSPQTAMISQVAADQMLVALNFPRGSAVIVILTVLTFLAVALYALIVRRLGRVDV